MQGQVEERRQKTDATKRIISPAPWSIIKQETSHIEFEAYFPPQLNMENSKSLPDVEGTHHNKICFQECK